MLQNQQTPLFLAVRTNYLDTATRLIGEGELIDACDSVSDKHDCAEKVLVIEDSIGIHMFEIKQHFV